MRLAWLLLLLAACEQPAPVAPDDAAQRIVTLAPHLAELLVAAGGESRLVGISAWTDYPPSITHLPQIGDAFMIDHERLALLEPDLLLAWESGTPAHAVEELRASGYRVEVLRTRRIAEVATALRRLGDMLGTGDVADRAAARFEQGIAGLQSRWAGAAPIRVFYQVDRRPVFTVNGDHFVSELIELCGGQNVFAELSGLAPMVSEEAVVERDPEVMLAAGDAGLDALAQWRRWPGLAANRYDNHFTVPADVVGRATPRLLDGAAAICARLEAGRRQRAAAGGG